MPRHVMGQRDRKAQFLPDGFQVPVDQMGGVNVLFSLVRPRPADNGKKVRGFGNSVAIHDLLHARLPFYKELLPGFLTPV